MPSPQPSRPEHTIAVERHSPLLQRCGQYASGSLRLASRPPASIRRMKRFGMEREPHKCGGSSLPSLQETIALQYSYSGRHSPDLQRNVCGGQLLPPRSWPSQPSSSSPCGHCFRPSQSAAREMQRPLRSQRNASAGQVWFSRALWVHSSSESSLQSARPSHTKNHEMHTPLERH